MAGLGIIATGAALLNYRKAKSEYDSLVEQRDGLMAAYDSISLAIERYNKNKDKVELPDINDKPNASFPDGFYVTTELRVANLVGKFMKARTSVYFVNNSDQTVKILSVEAYCTLLGQVVQMLGKIIDGAEEIKQVKKFGNAMYGGMLEIAPGTTIEVQLDGGISGLADMGALRQIVCDAAGKKLITSCPKINIQDVMTADYSIWWTDGKQPNMLNTYRLNVPGVLRYCGEAGLN